MSKDVPFSTLRKNYYRPHITDKQYENIPVKDTHFEIYQPKLELELLCKLLVMTITGFK